MPTLTINYRIRSFGYIKKTDMKEKKSFWQTGVGGVLKKVAPAAIDLVGDHIPGGALLKTIFKSEIEKSGLSAIEKEEAVMDFEKALKEYELRERDMLLQDLADARDLQKAALQQGDLFSKRFIYYLAAFIMLAIAVFVAMLFYVDIPEGNSEIVYMAFGIFMGIGTSVAAFFFGSSQGSKDKEAYLNKK
jgi:hypothetical protein